jgi:hypothetical protein
LTCKIIIKFSDFRFFESFEILSFRDFVTEPFFPNHVTITQTGVSHGNAKKNHNYIARMEMKPIKFIKFKIPKKLIKMFFMIQSNVFKTNSNSYHYEFYFFHIIFNCADFLIFISSFFFKFEIMMFFLEFLLFR